MIETKSFEALGLGPDLLVRHGESFTYDVAGTFVGTVVLEQLTKGGTIALVTATAPASGELILDAQGKARARVRFRCSAFTSGTIDTTLDHVTSEVVDTLALPGGDVVATLSEDGITLPNGKALLASQTYAETGHSYQPVAIDLELADGAGSDDGTDPKFLAPIMGNALGADVAGEGNYLAGVIGANSITGAASDYPVAGVLGLLMDGAQGARAIVQAHIDGSDPSAETTAEAAFGVSQANNHADSGVNYGLDLKGAANAHYTSGLPFVCKKAELRCSTGDVVVMVGDGAPTSGASGTGDDFAGTGSLYIDYTNANLYVQAGAIDAPDWKLVTRAA